MNEILADEEHYFPKTINEAIEAIMCHDFSERDIEIIEESSKKQIDKILPDFEDTIRIYCGFDSGNQKLLEVCGDKNMDPHDASRVIMLALWDYFHFTQ